MSYADLLRDPRWQRKRLEVMQRAEFACERCADTTTTLNVHHVRYVRGRMPWEYPDEELVCLCEPCHQREHGIEDVIEARDKAQREVWRTRGPLVLRVDDPEHNALVTRIAEINRLLPDATPSEQDDLLREKTDLAKQLRQRGHRPQWSALR